MARRALSLLLRCARACESVEAARRGAAADADDRADQTLRIVFLVVRLQEPLACRR